MAVAADRPEGPAGAFALYESQSAELRLVPQAVLLEHVPADGGGPAADCGLTRSRAPPSAAQSRAIRAALRLSNVSRQRYFSRSRLSGEGHVRREHVRRVRGSRTVAHSVSDRIPAIWRLISAPV